MSFKEVKELRRQGLLQEALTLAKRDIEAKPEEIWNKRSLGWVYYDFLKLYADQINHVEFRRILGLLSQLNLPLEEKMIFDQAAWQIGKIVNSMNFSHIIPEDIEGQRKENGTFSIMTFEKALCLYRTEIFEKIKQFHFTKPSSDYSFLFTMFLKNSSGLLLNEYINFADWWNFDHFMPVDYKKRTNADGKTFVSLAEQAIIKYAKNILSGEIVPETQQVLPNTDKIERFILQLDQIIENHPDLEHLIYYKAKLYLALGKNKEILDFILPLVRKKKKEFWIWDLLSEAFEDSDDIKFACLCKSLTCEAESKMKKRVRSKLYRLAILKGLINEGETGIEIKPLKILDRTNLKNDGPDTVTKKKMTTYEIDLINDNNNSRKVIYFNFASITSTIIYSDIPQELAVIEFVNKANKIMYFIISKEKAGYIKYGNIIKRVEVGDKFLLRLEGSGINRQYKVLSVERTSKPANKEISKKFKGKLRINPGQLSGYVKDIFIDREIINEAKLVDETEIKGIAILSFIKKQNTWRWKAIMVNKV